MGTAEIHFNWLVSTDFNTPLKSFEILLNIKMRMLLIVETWKQEPEFGNEFTAVIHCKMFWFLHGLQFYRINVACICQQWVSEKHMLFCGYCIAEPLSWWNRMLINFFWKNALFDLIQRTTSLLLFANNDFETSTYKRELCQNMLISARKKDETSKLMVHTQAWK